MLTILLVVILCTQTVYGIGSDTKFVLSKMKPDNCKYKSNNQKNNIAQYSEDLLANKKLLVKKLEAELINAQDTYNALQLTLSDHRISKNKYIDALQKKYLESKEKCSMLEQEINNTKEDINTIKFLTLQSTLNITKKINPEILMYDLTIKKNNIASKQEEKLVENIKPGDIFLHYKNKKYEVLGFARSSDNLELYVVYKALYQNIPFGENSIWIRNLSEFLENVTIDGKTMPRFKKIN